MKQFELNELNLGRAATSMRHARSLALIVMLFVLTATTAQTQHVSYIDEYGDLQYANATVINSDNKPTELTWGWYVVTSNVNYTEPITISERVNLILADNVTMNIVGTDGDRLEGNGISGNDNFCALTIYGQEKGNGALNIYTTGGHAIRSNYVTVNGGIVTADTEGDGTSAIYAQDEFTFRRGIVKAIADDTEPDDEGNRSYAIYVNDGRYYNFEWSEPTDKIIIGDAGLNTDGNTAYFNADKPFTDGSNIYENDLFGDDLNNLAGKTLRPAVEISYIDADGNQQTTMPIALDITMTTLEAGWYYVSSDITYDQTLTFNGGVHLILSDGATMNVGTSSNRIDGYGIDTGWLYIYGQSEGSGALNVYTTGDGNDAIYALSLNINGGTITANTDGDGAYAIISANGNLTINRATITATATGSNADGIYAARDVTINGSKVIATGTKAGIDGQYGNITLDWTNYTDYIYANSYNAGGSVILSKAFMDADGNIYSGTLSGTEAIATIANKALSPVVPSEGYYMVGTMTNWGLNINKKLTINPSNTNEYMLQQVTLAKDSEFKVVYSADGKALTTWYPSGTDNNYVVANDGIYDIYFRPDSHGGDDWHYHCIYLADASQVNVTFAPEGFASYFHSMYDVKLPADVKARIVTSNGSTEGTLNYLTIADGADSEGNVVPAGTAVMLQTTPADADQVKTLTLSAKSAEAYTGTNLLHGQDYSGLTYGGEKYYKLTYNTNGQDFGWYWGAEGGNAFTIPGHKAWLALPANAPAFSFFGLPGNDDDTTSLSEKGRVKSEKFATAAGYYTLDGRRLSGTPTEKGIYIVNGKKVIVK